MGLIKFIKSLFPTTREQVRVISIPRTVVHPINDEWYNHCLSVRLKFQISRGNIKQYANLKNFIDKHYNPNWSCDLDDVFELDELTITKDIKKLAQQFSLLGYKCDDEDLKDFMVNANSL